MTINVVMDLIDELEERFPVDRWVIDSVHVWPLIRFHLYHSFLDYQFFKPTVRAGTIRSFDFARIVVKILRSMWRFCCVQAMDSKNSQRANKRFDILLLNYNVYMTLLNGSWYSRLCDPFVGYLSERGMSSLTLTAGYEYSIPRFSKSMLVQPHLTMYRLIGMLNGHAKYESLEQLRELENHVRRSGLFPKAFSLIKPVRRHIKQITVIAKYFRWLLIKTKPRAVFVSCFYNTESMALILACHRMGIPSIDIQHGSQGDVHFAYGRWKRLPEKGYELLPTIFWCWSEFEADAIRKWSRNPNVHQPLVGGNLFLHRWVADGDDIVRAYDQLMRDLKRNYKDRIHILYSLNGCTTNELRTMVDIIQGVNKSGLHTYFWVRVHPVTIEQAPEVKRILEANGIDNVYVDNATQLPLYAILRHMDIHVTEFSSVVIEAESLSVPSIIYRLGVDNFPTQISSGWATPAYSIEDIITAILHQLDRRGLQKGKQGDRGVSADKAFDHLFDLISLCSKQAGYRGQSLTQDTLSSLSSSP